jgi:hypothetical protein
MTIEHRIEKWSKAGYLFGWTESEKANAAICLENQAQWLLINDETGVEHALVLKAVAEILRVLRGVYEATDLPAFIGKDNNAHVVMTTRLNNKCAHFFQGLVQCPSEENINVFANAVAAEYLLAAPDRLLYLYTPLCVYPLVPNDSNQKFGLSYRGIHVKK